MSTPNILSGKAGQWLLIGGVVLVVGAYLINRFGSALKNYTKDTPYEGTGALGALGQTADVATGGVLSSVGGAVGRTLYDWTHNDGTIEDTDTILSVVFPDGIRRSISDRRVQLGRFEYQGTTYTLSKDGAGLYHAAVA